MKEGNDEDKISTLTKLISELHIKQQQIHEEIIEATALVDEINQRRKKEPTIKEKQIKKVARGTRPKIGDTVTIVNPKGNQPTEGTVVGFTKTDYVKVQGKDGTIIRRIPRNILIHKES
jgi:hypothetical protein